MLHLIMLHLMTEKTDRWGEQNDQVNLLLTCSILGQLISRIPRKTLVLFRSPLQVAGTAGPTLMLSGFRIEMRSLIITLCRRVRSLEMCLLMLWRNDVTSKVDPISAPIGLRVRLVIVVKLADLARLRNDYVGFAYGLHVDAVLL